MAASSGSINTPVSMEVSNKFMTIKLWLAKPLLPQSYFYILTNANSNFSGSLIGMLNSVPLNATFSTTIPSFLQEYATTCSNWTSVVTLSQIPGITYKYSTTIPNDLTLQFITSSNGQVPFPSQQSPIHVYSLIVTAIGNLIIGASAISALLPAVIPSIPVPGTAKLFPRLISPRE